MMATYGHEGGGALNDDQRGGHCEMSAGMTTARERAESEINTFLAQRGSLNVDVFQAMPTIESAITAAVADARREMANEAVAIVRRYLQFNNQRAVSWHEVNDACKAIRAEVERRKTSP